MGAGFIYNDIERALSLIESFGNAVFISESEGAGEGLAARTFARLNNQGSGRQVVRMDTAALMKAAKGEAGQKPISVIGITDMAGFRRLEGIPDFAGSLQFILSGKEKPQTRRNKSVLIIGATAFLGRAVYDLFSREYENVRGTGFSKAGLLGFDKLDVTSEEEIKRYFLRHPDFDIVIYIAGEASADRAEKEKERTRMLNTDAVGIIARYAANCKFVYISSEYVFDGNSGPYASCSAANPINYYGQTKLEGERASLNNFSGALVVRLGALYGYNGPSDKQTSVTKLIASLDKEGPLEADNVQIKHPLLLEDAAGTLLKLLDYGVSGIYQVNGPEGLNKQEMAERIAAVRSELTGRNFSYPIVGAEETGAAGRPFNTHMVNVDTPRPFDEGTCFLLEEQGASGEKKHEPAS
jgi:S-adenosylmethionine synthetase